MGLDLEHLVAREHLESLQAVLEAALVEVLEPGEFGFIGSHDELAADFVGDIVVAAELDHLLDAADSQSRFD